MNHFSANLMALTLLMTLSSLATADAALAGVSSGTPAGLIFENRSQPFLLWVELDAGRLQVIERLTTGGYVTRLTLPVSIGKNGIGKRTEGDQKTPVGVYRVTSFLGDDQLNDYYGAGAYPVNFPNAWDRISGRTGHGIWLHGLPKGITQRPPLDSDGCVIIPNSGLEQLREFVSIGDSPVVLAPAIKWLPDDTPQSGTDVLTAIEGWKQAWESNDAEAYLAYYHPDFSDSTRDLAAFRAYKTRINRGKRFIRVNLTEMTVFAYPLEDDLVTVQFHQDYSSSNHVWQGRKQLLWRRDESGAWRILYEGNG
jgi:murein L,D-transpeptidase YafK